jgi:tetratricopeptide (TPR) repeat protein
MNSFKHTKYFSIGAGFLWLMMSWLFLGGGMSLAAGVQGEANNHLQRAKIYLAAGDYRRAVEACQRNVDETPSVESYVYLIYVYHAIDGYQEWLAQQDKWGEVGRLAQSMVNRGAMELVDPPSTLSRMAKEILHEGLRVQFDIVAGMANRLDKARVDELWLERKAWEEAHPETWWAGVPESWNW